MQFQRVIAPAVVAMFLAVPASAAQPQQAGLFASADYGHASSADGNADSWGIGFGGQMPFRNSGVHLQIDGAYTGINFESVSVHTWNAGANPYYAWPTGRAGISLNYVGQQTLGYGDGTQTAFTYGAYGEWFFGRHFTVGIKSGTVNEGAGISNETYLGARLATYLFPDFVLSGTIDYTRVSSSISENDSTFQGEYLVSETLPISVFGGYTLANSNSLGSVHVHLIFLGLKIYADGRGTHTLVDRQRNGTLGWLASFGTSNF